MPRLEWLRVDLSTMCAGIFEIDSLCPKLTTLVVSCFAGGYLSSRLCGSYTEDSSHSAFVRGEEAMSLLVSQIQTVLHLLPSLKQCIVVDQSGNPSTNSAYHLTYNVRDVLKDTVTAMLVEYVHPFADDGDGYMLRTPEGDVFGSLKALRAAAAAFEGGVFGGNTTGSTIVDSNSIGSIPSSHDENAEAPALLSATSWRAKYPRRGSRLWSSDQRNGGKQVEAAKVVAGAATMVRVAKLLGPEDEGVVVLRDYEGEEW